MEELRRLETFQLLDMLSRFTEEYTGMLAKGTREEEYSKYKLTITAIQDEIAQRKKEGNNQGPLQPEFT